MCVPFFRLRHNIKARVYLVPIIILAPLYNVPRFFEFTWIAKSFYSCADTDTSEWMSQEQFANLSAAEVAECVEWRKEEIDTTIITEFRMNRLYVRVSDGEALISLAMTNT